MEEIFVCCHPSLTENKIKCQRNHDRKQNDDEELEKNKERMRQQRRRLREEEDSPLVQQAPMEDNYGKF